VSARELVICRNCVREIPYVGGCVAEEFEQFLGRWGRHGGKCWRGLFPQPEDYGRSATRLSIRNVARLARMQKERTR
jgi:hypothetical protein